jgi:WD40 repeat protein
VQVSPDGRSVAAGSRDGSVWIWDLATREEIARLPRQDVPVICVRWSKRGDCLAISLGPCAWLGPDLESDPEPVQTALLLWTPKEDVVSRHQLAEPVAAIDWLGDERLVVADWKGFCRVLSLDFEEQGDPFMLDNKDRVSASHWSPDCPLVSKAQAEQLATNVP